MYVYVHTIRSIVAERIARNQSQDYTFALKSLGRKQLCWKLRPGVKGGVRGEGSG